MPLVDINDPVHLGIRCNAEPQGHPGTRGPIYLTYARYHAMPILRERWAWLVPLLGLTPTSSIVLVGASYGYSLEILAADFGITRVIGLETSAGIRTKMAQSEDADVQAAIEAVGLSMATDDGLAAYARLRDRPGQPRSTKTADVLNEDMANNASRNRVRQALLGKGGTTWDVITENVCTVLSDAECTTLSGRAHTLAGIARLIHLNSTARIKTNAEGSQRFDLNPGYNSKTVQEWKALLPADTIVSLYTQEML